MAPVEDKPNINITLEDSIALVDLLHENSGMSPRHGDVVICSFQQIFTMRNKSSFSGSSPSSVSSLLLECTSSVSRMIGKNCENFTALSLREED